MRLLLLAFFHQAAIILSAVKPAKVDAKKDTSFAMGSQSKSN
jgi:hypothetical protein